MSAVFDAIRAAAAPSTWSKGIELVRADAVEGESDDAGEVVVRVALRGGMLSRTVTLWPDDGDWECSCGASRACEHAVAAAIALKRARESGQALPSRKFESGRVAYRFARGPGGLEIARGIETAEGWHPFDATLAALAEKRVDAPPFTASSEDLACELALGTHRRGAIPRAAIAKVLAALDGVERVSLDGEPVRCSGEPVLPSIVVTDQGDGFRLGLEPDRSAGERFANGAFLCGDVLRPAGDPRLTGKELAELPRGVHVARSDVAALVTEVLPSLSRRLPVDVRTTRLPRAATTPPRIAIDARREGETLSVLATLVYGDPPSARVDAGQLVHLRGDVPMRDARAEERLVRRLATELGLAPGSPQRFDGEGAVLFRERLRAWEGVRGEGLEAFALRAPLVPRVTVSGDRFEVEFASAEPGSRRRGAADPERVVRAWREGASLVPLLDGGWAPLPSDWLARHGARVSDLLFARDAAGTLAPSAIPDLARLCEELDLPTPPSFGKLRSLVDGFERVPTTAPPEDLVAELRPYQKRGIDWLCFLRDAGLGALLADDMGLGKTLQALASLRGRALVVAPTSVLHNWLDEIARFRPGRKTLLYHGPRRALDPEADVTVTSYALLRLDEEVLSSVAWDAVVLDEAQSIKNPESQAAQAAFRLRAGFRVALSGTPVENRLDELWSQMHFLNRGLLGGRRDFQDLYARPIGDGEPGAAARLRERIRPFVLRRLKREVAPELPPRTESVLYCELTDEEREVYDAVRAAARSDVVARLQRGGSVLAALEALLRLRQAACHAGLVPGQSAETSSKVERLLESLETIVEEGHKALVFSQWTALLDRVEPHLAAHGITHLRLDGSTVDRAGVVRAFQDDAGPPVLLVSLKAGGTGLNLTRADHVFLLDPWWNPAVEDQAADRAHRIGQDRPVLVYRLVAEGTVEERILALQASKRAIADAALGGADRAQSLTREDLLALLE